MLVYGKYECFAMQMLYACVHHVAVLMLHSALLAVC